MIASIKLNKIFIFYTSKNENKIGYFKTELITRSECNIPIFIASGLISLDENSICLEISVCDTGNIDETPVVFCDVTAVNAVIAYDPK